MPVSLVRLAWPAAVTVAALAAAVARPAPANPPAPLVEQYLHSGDLARGEHALLRALDAKPADDQARFGLGVLQVARAVERFGRAMHEHGLKPENADRGSVPFLRVPVPENPDPTPITYPVLRRVFEQLADDLAKAEATLARVTSDDVVLPLRLGAVRFDFAGDGKPSESLLEILAKLSRGQRFEFVLANPTFRVHFDRGDVAWLRGYCHVLGAVVDLYLAADMKFVFDQYGSDHFAKPKGQGEKHHMVKLLLEDGVRLPEPARLRSVRQHLLAVCELNREQWRHVRAERDDSYEWLPSAKQKGVLGLPVRDDMIDAWLAAVAEFEAVLKGDKLVDMDGLARTPADRGLDIRAFLDDAPAKLDIGKILDKGVEAKYLGKLTGANRANQGTFNRAWTAFGANSGFLYAAFFN